MVSTMGFESFSISGGMGCAPALGNSTFTPSASSGAVIMKMISSTSITSMYGTTLISPMRRRRRVFFWTEAMSSSLRAPCVALQDGGELFHECVVAQLQAAHLVGVAVVRDHRRDGGKQTDGRGDQRLGDARRHHGQRGLLHAAQRDERAHDAPHR